MPSPESPQSSTNWWPATPVIAVPPIILAASIYHDLEISGAITVKGAGGGLITSLFPWRGVTLNSGGKLLAEGGGLTITAPLRNNGTVRAGGNSCEDQGPVTVAFIVAPPAAASSGRFEVDHEDARMLFAIGSGVTFTGGAHFDVRKGEMVFAGSVTTNGGLRMLGGSILVIGGRTFKATGAFVAP
jgi:hypothetical protein